MICLFLAAGYATRMYPLTLNQPKPLLEVGGKPILDWLIDDIADCVDKFAVISNQKYFDRFEDWVKSRKENITLLNDGSTSNDNRLGAVKDIQFAIDKLGIDEDILVLAGDNLLDFSLKPFIAYSAEKNAPCVMRYYQGDVEKLKKTGIADIGENDIIKTMLEKCQNPPYNWCIPPFYFYNKATLPMIKKGIDSGCGVDAPGNFLSWLVGETDVYAMPMPGNRYDIGDIAGYEKIKKLYDNNLKGEISNV
ncbi:MAG: nucleotidyltransferase family protein [Clostridia bacterium]|nr:nucleotidyltransferase family protein [Clostridia bacterium]